MKSDDAGAAAGAPDLRRSRWSDFLWALIFPTTRQRVTPTVPGLVLIGLAFGIGSAAYNAANNILFLTLSLLLSCLILSGVMSWVNLRRVAWNLQVPGPLRAGQEAPVTLELRNGKSLVPVYGLWFDVVMRVASRGPRRPESTFRANSRQIRTAFAQLDKLTERVTLFQRERLDPGEETRLDWVVTPTRRGAVRVELTGVGSLFPFGFLRKSQGTVLRHDAVVWPAPVEYQFVRAAAAAHAADGKLLTAVGTSNDLLSLRRYQAGDSHRLIHWKASARLRRFMVRQYAAEGTATYFLRVDSAAGLWPREEQFERMCSFAATLSEDLFTEGRLIGAAIDSGAPIAIRRVRELESFLDQLAVLEWNDAAPGPEAGARAAVREGGVKSDGALRFARIRRQVITFSPEASRGVSAYVDGQRTATA